MTTQLRLINIATYSILLTDSPIKTQTSANLRYEEQQVVYFATYVYITQLPAKAFHNLQPSITPQQTLTIFRVGVLNIATNVKEIEICAKLRKLHYGNRRHMKHDNNKLIFTDH